MSRKFCGANIDYELGPHGSLDPLWKQLDNYDRTQLNKEQTIVTLGGCALGIAGILVGIFTKNPAVSGVSATVGLGSFGLTGLYSAAVNKEKREKGWGDS